MNPLICPKLDNVIVPVNPVRSGDNIVGIVKTSLPIEQSGYSATSQIETEEIPYQGDFTIEIWSYENGKIATYNCQDSNFSIPSSGLTGGIHYLNLIVDGTQADVASIIIK